MLCHTVFHKLYPRTLHKVAGQNLFTLKFSKYGGTMWIENITRGEWVEGVNCFKVPGDQWVKKYNEICDAVPSWEPSHSYLRRWWGLQKLSKGGGCEVFYKNEGLVFRGDSVKNPTYFWVESSYSFTLTIT